MMNRRLLVIDDEPDFAEFVGRVAQGVGYDVTVTNRAVDFKDAYDAVDPTVIVLDVVMPEVEGIELVQWLADRQCRAKILVVTGYNPHYSELAKVLGEAKGLSSVVTMTKPLHVADLRLALEVEGTA